MITSFEYYFQLLCFFYPYIFVIHSGCNIHIVLFAKKQFIWRCSLKNCFLKNFAKVQRKAPVPESLYQFICRPPELLSKKRLQHVNFEQPICRTSANGCFCLFSITTLPSFSSEKRIAILLSSRLFVKWKISFFKLYIFCNDIFVTLHSYEWQHSKSSELLDKFRHLIS